MSDLGMAHALKKRSKSVAQGGAVDSADEQDADMIARIMHKRKAYADGGEVGAEPEPIADAEPAEFDVAEKDDFIGSIMKKRKDAAP